MPPIQAPNGFTLDPDASLRKLGDRAGVDVSGLSGNPLAGGVATIFDLLGTAFGGKGGKDAPQQMPPMATASQGFYQPTTRDNRSALLTTMMQRSRAGRANPNMPATAPTTTPAAGM